MASRKKKTKKVTRYVHEDAHDPRTPETGHTPLLPGEEEVVTLEMDNGWSRALEVARVDEDKTVLVDMDPAVDPVLMWAGKRNRREIPVLPLQRNEIITESRISQIIERARKHAGTTDNRQGSLFADLEKELRESDKDKRVEFYTHDEEWKNKLITGDSLPVMESLIKYEGLAGKVQMIFFDPPYGISYNSNHQQRVDTPRNEERDRGDDVLTIRAYNDTWVTGVHSYLSHIAERAYLGRELMAGDGSFFMQISPDNQHLLRSVLDEVFGKSNFAGQIVFRKTSAKGSGFLDSTYDLLLWYTRDLDRAKRRFAPLYHERKGTDLAGQYTRVETVDGEVLSLSSKQLAGIEPAPAGRRFRPVLLSSQSGSENYQFGYEFEGRTYFPPSNRYWSTSRKGLDRLVSLGRIIPIGKRLYWKYYADDAAYVPYRDIWEDTLSTGFGGTKLYSVQTPPSVLEKCILMTTRPGELVFDPTCGSGTTAVVAEQYGRRWITCDTSRVAINTTRVRLLSQVFDTYRLRSASPSGGFDYETMERVRLKTLVYDMEPESTPLLNRPIRDTNAVRMTGPFEIATLGRYSVEDWQGYIAQDSSLGEESRLGDYVDVICRLYMPNSEVEGGVGLVHAIHESADDQIGISVGPLTGRVTARQVYDAVEDARALGLSKVHMVGWAFEANVGEVKSELEASGDIAIELVMIRPDALAEGLKITKPSELFSPLALPEIEIVRDGDGVQVILKGVGLFNRKTKKTEYHKADSGYIAAWYLDEDYDGDCFVDCQMFFDFKKAPNLKPAVGGAVEADEFKLAFTSEPFEPGEYRRVAVKVVDVYGNESTVVRDL